MFIKIQDIHFGYRGGWSEASVSEIHNLLLLDA